MSAIQGEPWEESGIHGLQQAKYPEKPATRTLTKSIMSLSKLEMMVSC